MNRLDINPGDLVGNCVYLNEEETIKGTRYAKFKCRCGSEFICKIGKVKAEKTNSCGCFQRETARNTLYKHGNSQRPEYKSWWSMINRCTNPEYDRYEDWGGRGISVCAEWMEFDNFFKDMGSRPKEKTLERRNNDKGYFKENCYWGTKLEQENNKRNNLIILYNGEEKTLAQWVRLLDLDYGLVNKRISQQKWSPERAFLTPKQIHKCR